MELHAFHCRFAMPHSHDLTIVALRGDLEARGQARALNDERVVASGRERILESAEYARAVVLHRGQLAVHHTPRPDDPSPEGLTDRLVTEADAEDWNFTCEALDQWHTDTRFRGRARSRREHDPFWFPGSDLLEGQRIVAIDLHVRPELTEILHEVVGKAVVVVDHEQHGSFLVSLVE